MFDRVAEQCNENEEWYDQLKDRLENVLDNASDVGWDIATPFVIAMRLFNGRGTKNNGRATSNFY
ncbi:hypothetical protein [Priestia koreensis]|uniref:hypothetical protein n=1 Tax=Priestia koreensis TaxID=284581 RepID=UPI00203DD701|nr:hypothetical protein [Priestia koreensis]MCM3004566.1 hypothetical protein [Priestia koreensis]